MTFLKAMWGGVCNAGWRLRYGRAMEKRIDCCFKSRYRGMFGYMWIVSEYKYVDL